jgi:hypothetical protein
MWEPGLSLLPVNKKMLDVVLYISGVRIGTRGWQARHLPQSGFFLCGGGGEIKIKKYKELQQILILKFTKQTILLS